jgi:hypothetical protein
MDQRQTLGQTLRRFALAVVVVALGGLAFGWLFAKGQPRAAAGAVISDFVEVFDSAGNERLPADAAAVAPTSGNHDGVIRCGVHLEAVSNDDHLEALAAGVIVVRYAPGLDPLEVAALTDFATERGRILVAPEPRLDVPVVALAWSHRMPLANVNEELLAAFHTARVGIAPSVIADPCVDAR